MSSIAIVRADWRPAIRALAPDQAVAAIGDVHGHDDLLAALMDAIAAELTDAARPAFVQLGDLVDRGPASRAALLRAKRGLPGVPSATLMGNHEDRMLSAIEGDPNEQALWLDFGGRETLQSFGVAPDAPDWPRRLGDALAAEGLADWLAGLPTFLRIGPLFFAHAGVEPTTPLDRQTRRDLMWIRWAFLDHPGPFAEEVAVVHGHTPTTPVDLAHPHRINLDTGAFRTGLLSGLVISGDRMRLVQAARS